MGARRERQFSRERRDAWANGPVRGAAAQRWGDGGATATHRSQRIVQMSGCTGQESAFLRHLAFTHEFEALFEVDPGANPP
jgi:hypothetical protein